MCNKIQGSQNAVPVIDVVSSGRDEPRFGSRRVFIECLCTGSSSGKCDRAGTSQDSALSHSITNLERTKIGKKLIHKK